MSLKDKIFLGLIALVVLLSLSTTIGFRMASDNKKNAIRWEDNYNESQESVSRVQMTLTEFKKHSTEREDSLLKELSIKPKQVEKVIYIHTEELNNDTVQVDLTPVDTIQDVIEYNFIEPIGCSMVSGVVSTTDPNTELEITSLFTSYDYYYVAYWQREKRSILGIKTRLFGRKKAELEVHNSCGTTSVQEIEIIKKKKR